MNQFSNNGNLGSIPKLELDWSDENAEKSLKDFYQYSIGIADKIVAWYVHAKSWKKVGARAIRFLAILFGAINEYFSPLISTACFSFRLCRRLINASKYFLSI